MQSKFKSKLKTEEESILDLIKEINVKLDFLTNKALLDLWLPKKVVMKFFDYGETQMLVLEKENGLVTSKIKGRKFYSVQSLRSLIEKNIISKNQ